MEIIHNIALDVSRHGVQATIPITKGENGVHRLIVTLRNKGVPIVFDERDMAVIYLDPNSFDPVTVYTKDGAYPNSLCYDVSAHASATVGAKKATFQLSRTSKNILFTADIIFNVCDNRSYNTHVLDSPPYAAVIKAQLAAEESAYKSESEADRAKSEADKAESIAAETSEKIAAETSEKIVTEFIENELPKKLDKMENTTGLLKVYAVSPDNNPFLLSADEGDTPGSIVLRDDNGHIQTPDPTDDSHVASKWYVDEQVFQSQTYLEDRIGWVEDIAKGATKAIAFSDYAELVSELNDALDDKYYIGQPFLVLKSDVPDLWVYAVSKEFVNFDYIDDTNVIDEIIANGYVHIGYYQLAMLETEKVDLEGYVKNTDYANSSKGGVVKVNTAYGSDVNSQGTLRLVKATNNEVDQRKHSYHPIVPSNLDYAVNSVLGVNGTWTEISENRKRIINLEERIEPDPFVTDYSVAMTRAVPQKALPYAYIPRICGACDSSLQRASVERLEFINNVMSPYEVYKGADSYSEEILDGRDVIRITTAQTVQNSSDVFRENTVYTVSLYAKSTQKSSGSAPPVIFSFYYSDGSKDDIIASIRLHDWTLFTLTSRSGKTISAVGAYVQTNTVYTYIDVNSFKLYEGTAPNTVYEIPTSVRAISTYGLGDPENALRCNYIDLESKSFVEIGNIVSGKWTEHAEPIETDISEYLTNMPSDAFFKVPAGGRIVFSNPNGLNVPGEITYQLKT